jgi:hypothetical protein
MSEMLIRATAVAQLLYPESLDLARRSHSKLP